MTTRALVASVLLAFATPAVASSVNAELAAIDGRLKACTDKDESNIGMKMCTSDAFDAADKVLNRLYKAAADKLKSGSSDTGDDDKEILKRLIASERAWVAYKTAECELQGTSMLNGTGEGLVIDGCLFTMTKERAKALDDLFNEK